MNGADVGACAITRSLDRSPIQRQYRRPIDHSPDRSLDRAPDRPRSYSTAT
jgi:hypothetical protein